MSTNESSHSHVPLGLRIGGAFMALALVIAIYLVIAVATQGLNGVFVLDARTALVFLAAALCGAFATTNKHQPGSRSQVIALGVAVVLLIASRFLPPYLLSVMPHYWLAAYAVLALLCGLIIRRSYM